MVTSALGRYLEQAFDAGPAELALLDRELRILRVNGACARRAGRAVDEMAGRELPEHVPSGTRSYCQEAVRTGLVQEARACRREEPGPAGRSATFWDLCIVPIVDDAGRVEALLLSLCDVTPQVLAARELERTGARLRSLVEHAGDVLLVVNHDCVIQYASPSVERVLGCPAAETVGTGLFPLLHEDDLDAARVWFAEALSRPRGMSPPPRVAFRCRHRDGTWRTMDLSATGLLDDEAVGGVVINARDITDSVQLQAQMLQVQKLEIIGKLAGGVAHDFNNLLTVIRSGAGALMDAIGAGDPLFEDAESVAVAADQAAALSRRLLALSRPQVSHPRVLDVGAVVTDMGGVLERLIGEDITLVTAVEAGAPPLVLADPGQLEQVVLNLCVNSRDAMPKGGSVTITVRQGDAPGAAPGEAPMQVADDWVVIEVSDTGVGMSPEVQARVFEPFFTTKPHGTGLGLATVHDIVERSQGHVRLTSTPGVGTRFMVFLPRVRGVSPPSEAPRPAPAKPPRARPGETVLVAEDEDVLRAALRRHLRRLGYRVVDVADGVAALALVRGGMRPALVIADVVMPGMRGMDLAAQIEAEAPGIPVLLMSGYADVPSVEGAGPAHRLMAKPFTLESVAGAVRAAIDGAAGA